MNDTYCVNKYCANDTYCVNKYCVNDTYCVNKYCANDTYCVNKYCGLNLNQVGVWTHCIVYSDCVVIESKRYLMYLMFYCSVSFNELFIQVISA